MGENILILGGTRSGKSRAAERLAAGREPVAYVATAALDPSDPEMTARIGRHRAGRPRSWTTWEVPYDLVRTLPAIVAAGGTVLIDCLTLWLTNLMLGQGGPPLADEAILAAVAQAAAVRGPARVVWVSNEVGSGIVPLNAMARRFADLQGLANQVLAEACDAVHLCVAGLTVRLK